MSSLALTAVVIVTSFEMFKIVPVETHRSLAALASFALCFKIFDWLRLFEKTAFLVLLLIQTLVDISDFMILIAISLIMFGIPMTILDDNRGEDDSI